MTFGQDDLEQEECLGQAKTKTMQLEIVGGLPAAEWQEGSRMNLKANKLTAK